MVLATKEMRVGLLLVLTDKQTFGVPILILRCPV
jgi:hypothetical protein